MRLIVSFLKYLEGEGIMNEIPIINLCLDFLKEVLPERVKRSNDDWLQVRFQ